MDYCERFKQTLGVTGRAGIEQNADLANHLSDCAACQQLLHAWDQIPGLLKQLPEHDPDEAVLRAVGRKLTTAGRNSLPGRRRYLAPSLASAAVLLAAIGLSRELLLHEAPKAPVTIETRGDLGQSLGGPMDDSSIDRSDVAAGYRETQLPANSPEPLELDRLQETEDHRGNDASVFAAQEKAADSEMPDQHGLTGGRASGALAASEPVSHVGDEILARRKAQPQKPSLPSAAPSARKLGNERIAELPAVAELETPESKEAPGHGQTGAKADFKDTDGELENGTDQNGFRTTQPEGGKLRLETELGGGAVESSKTESYRKEGRQRQAAANKTTGSAVAGGAGSYADSGAESNTSSGFDFLRYYQQTGNLQFQEAAGYWANTYIPGDPEIRWLSARLAQWDRGWLPGDTGLEQSVAPVEQPFDAPDDNALALSLMADANAVMPAGAAHQATRMRVQVGIRAIEHRQGQRPAMNVGVVVDLPADAPDAIRIAGRALVDALLQSKQTGDRFSLVLTSQGSKSRSLVVTPGDFRFGPLQLARQIILGQDPAAKQTDGAGPEPGGLDLYAAVRQAEAMVQQNDDPSRPLGSSSVLLISAAQIDGLDRLLALAHDSAQKGITLSVFPLGEQAKASQVDRLVLAGLGNRRFLETPGQARELIEAELYASSRAVARAARLSIRLAPGVQLIGVVGSERLDTERSQRVREIENSLDRRLSENLGIRADRGEDEEGIQILIPGIYSGDSVVILLDVVTGRPGAIADASLRYKDLVFLRNGSLQGHLELPEGELKRGPAELAVLKNLLSHHFVLAARQAAAALGRGQANDAAGFLRAMDATISQVRQAVPEWAQDPDLMRDQQVLERYITTLASPQAGAHQPFLADSLLYAAWAKTHRGMKEWK